MNKKINPLAWFGFLGFIGILGIITGELIWYTWFAWFTWFGKIKKPTDERFIRNLGKSGLICFVITMIALSAVTILKVMNISDKIIFFIIGTLFALLILTFTLSFEYFEKRGE